MQYQTLRSVSDHHVFVICRDGSFYEFVPRDVRKQGPWQGMQRGEVEKLKPVPPGVRARRLCSREVRARGIQAGVLNARGAGPRNQTGTLPVEPTSLYHHPQPQPRWPCRQPR